MTAFQSPSLRGSGRFVPGPWQTPEGQGRFNPLHCGAVVASDVRRRRWRRRRRCFNPLHCGAVVASTARRSRDARRGSGFNPLHCGAVVASRAVFRCARAPRVSIPFIAGQWSLQAKAEAEARARRQVSIPFIAGQWSLPLAARRGRARRNKFQSPSLRGSGRFQRHSHPPRGSHACFNPLHCGAVVASLES